MNGDAKQFYREFGKRLAGVRNSAQITQQALADAIGLSRTSITNIEKGRQQIPFHLAVKIARVVGTQLDVLVSAMYPAMTVQNKKIDQLQPEKRRWVESILVGAPQTGGEKDASQIPVIQEESTRSSTQRKRH